MHHLGHVPVIHVCDLNLEVLQFIGSIQHSVHQRTRDNTVIRDSLGLLTCSVLRNYALPSLDQFNNEPGSPRRRYSSPRQSNCQNADTQELWILCKSLILWQVSLASFEGYENDRWPPLIYPQSTELFSAIASIHFFHSLYLRLTSLSI